jgi:hypothetical protein
MSNKKNTEQKPKTIVLSGDSEFILLNEEAEKTIDSLLSDISQYINENTGKGKSEEEKDELYKVATEKWKKFSAELRELKYNFFLNKDQWLFITNLLENKLEYDVNTIFLALEIKNILRQEEGFKIFTSSDTLEFPVNATEITYLYHLISTHKTVGLSRDSIMFSEILIKIADIMKIVNYYDTEGKRLSADIQDWVVLFEDGITSDKDKK